MFRNTVPLAYPLFIMGSQSTRGTEPGMCVSIYVCARVLTTQHRPECANSYRRMRRAKHRDANKGELSKDERLLRRLPIYRQASWQRSKADGKGARSSKLEKIGPTCGPIIACSMQREGNGQTRVEAGMIAWLTKHATN